MEQGEIVSRNGQWAGGMDDATVAARDPSFWLRPAGTRAGLDDVFAGVIGACGGGTHPDARYGDRGGDGGGFGEIVASGD